MEELFVPQPGGQGQQVFRGQRPDCGILWPTETRQMVPQLGREGLESGPEPHGPRVVEVFSELEELHEPGHVVTVAVVEASLGSVVLHHGGCCLTHRSLFSAQLIVKAHTKLCRQLRDDEVRITEGLSVQFYVGNLVSLRMEFRSEDIFILDVGESQPGLQL